MTEYLTVNSNLFEIQWLNRARTDRPCLVFLHEGLGCTAMWKGFPARISDALGCPALVFSRLGYGKSGPSPLPWKLNFMHTEALQVLPEVIKAAQIEDYILIGHSDGGSIGIIFAGSQLAAGLIALVTEAAHVFCERLTVKSIAKAKINYESGSLKQGLEKYHLKNTDNAFYGWNNVWLDPKFMHWNIEKYLKRIDVPMLALQGKNDQYGTVKQINSIEKQVTDVTCRLIEDCCHAPHLEQPDKTLELMVEFIGKLI